MLRAVSDGTKIFRQLDLTDGIRETFGEWVQFKNWLSTRQIFMHETIYRALMEIRDALQCIVIRSGMYTGRDAMPIEQRAEIYRFLANDMNEKVDSLALMIRGRFGFTDETVPPVPHAPTVIQ